MFSPVPFCRCFLCPDTWYIWIVAHFVLREWTWLLDLQKIEGKGIEEKKDSRNKTHGREIIGGRKGPENAPAQKTMQEDKDTDKDTDVLNEQGGQTDTSS